ncbi:PAS domain S-box protein [Marinovum sp.]|uniref:sensor histidine kinase n=1 Tax=Marinovum sp. TaxID=2024839 RepID=UPI002B277B41|nr:PAS domain S-box protein [Marinovum sp.]
MALNFDPGALAGLGALDLLEAMHDEVVMLDATGRIVAVNAAWRRFCIENGGDEDTCYLGQSYFQTCNTAEGDSSAEARLIATGLQKVLINGQPFRCEYPCDSPTLKRWFELTANRLQHDGAVYLIVQHRNITTRKSEQREVEEAFIKASAMTALIATSNDAIISYDLRGRIITWNPSAERLYGYRADEAVGRPLELIYPEGWPKPVSQYRDEIIAGRLERFEAPRVAKDGTVHEVWIACAPIRSPEGEVVAISNIHRDVTEIRRAEKAREVIAGEVIHRAKNMLSIVMAIQRQTARRAGSLEEFNTAFEARLRSLSQSTDLLVQSNWTTVSLSQLIDRHLEPFIELGDGRIERIGPDIDLRPQCVQTIGMALHELATNSVKHGALRDGHGRIGIRWSLEAGADARLHLCWDETGVPMAPVAPAAKGFGSTVLTTLAPSMLAAQSAYDIGRDGVTWSIRVPDEHFSLPS